LHTDKEVFGDLGGAFPFREKLEDLPFPCREHGENRIVGCLRKLDIVADDDFRYLRAQVRVVAQGGADGAGQLLIGVVLENVAGRASLEHLHHMALVRMHGQGDYLGPGKSGNDLTGRLDAVQIGHGNIHNHHVRRQFQGGPDRVSAVVGLGDHFDIELFLDKAAQPVTDDFVIVGDNDPDAHGEAPSLTASCNCAARVTRVPQPGVDSTVISPPRWSTRSRMLNRPKPRVPGDWVTSADGSKPLPSSATTMSRREPSLRQETRALSAKPCLTMLTRSSRTARKKRICMSSGSGLGS